MNKNILLISLQNSSQIYLITLLVRKLTNVNITPVRKTQVMENNTNKFLQHQPNEDSTGH